MNTKFKKWIVRKLNRPGFTGESICWENRAMNTQKRYSPEFRERAVRLVLEHKDKYPSEWAALTSIAEKMGCTAETLRNWLRRTELDPAQAPRRQPR